MGISIQYTDVVNQITFIGRQTSTGAVDIFGPYGAPYGRNAIIYGKIQGFYGHSEEGINEIRAIGIIYM